MCCLLMYGLNKADVYLFSEIIGKKKKKNKKDLFMAGTDTSAVGIQWAIAELINHPEVL